MSSLIAFIESIPALVKLVQTFIDQWQDYQISKIEDKYSDKAMQRTSLINAIKKADTDEERKTLIKLLYNINHPS